MIYREKKAYRSSNHDTFARKKSPNRNTGKNTHPNDLVNLSPPNHTNSLTQLNRLQLVVVVGVVRNLLLDTLALAHIGNDSTGLGSGVDGGTTRENLPMVEDGLGESLSTSVGTEIGSETERLVDGQVGLDVEEGL